MTLSSKLDQLHSRVKGNKWFRYFAVFNRIALAAGFLPSGFVKIFGERFTDLSVNHPLGNYLEALFYTGYYYTFIGILQVTAAILLLIPRTATLGAVIYFPIILNICILSLAMRFDGSLVSSPLMVLANLYLLCWDYDKLKFILPFKRENTLDSSTSQIESNNKFPKYFFAGVAATVIILVILLSNVYNIKPRNTISDCESQCIDSDYKEACIQFCDCIHNHGKTLHECLEEYNRAVELKKNEE